MVFRSLREFLAFLADEDRLRHVEGADADLEIGGLTEIAVRNYEEAAFLFDEIPGYEPGRRIVTGTVTTPYLWSVAAGLEPTTSTREAIRAEKDRLDRSDIDLVSPEVVESGPVRENVQRDDAVDVEAFPAPTWHEHDGGRYVGTGDVVLTRNRETDGVNAGTYRVQVHDPSTVTVYMTPGKDGRIDLNTYLERDDPAPMAVSLGHPVDMFLAASGRVSSSISELDYLGGMRGEAIEVLPGEVTDLPIPAQSELVFEGHVYPDDDPIPEGPFGEFTGYYVTGEEISESEGEHTVRPLRVERVYHREDPIILGSPPLKPPYEVRTVVRNATLTWRELEDAGLPGIHEVNAMRFAAPFCQVVSIDQQYTGHSVQVGTQVVSGMINGTIGRWAIVVDDDVDVYDQDEVLWALLTRCDPEADFHVIAGHKATPLDPLIPPEKRERGDLSTSRVVMDATRPYHWREEFPTVNEASDDLLADLHEEWGDLFENV